MSVGDLLFEVSKRGIALTYHQDEDRLNAKPTNAITPELATAIKEHRAAVINIYA